MRAHRHLRTSVHSGVDAERVMLFGESKPVYLDVKRGKRQRLGEENIDERRSDRS